MTWTEAFWNYGAVGVWSIWGGYCAAKVYRHRDNDKLEMWLSLLLITLCLLAVATTRVAAEVIR